MVRRGYVGTVREAFDRFLALGKPAYVPHRKLEPSEACAIIRRAGGLSVVAHPGFHADPEAMVRSLAGTGLLDGVECYYAEHSPEQTARLLGLCRELDLVPTGGSDFHGPRVRAATLGQPPVPWAAWEALRRRAGR
jgi:predicted metal-dependent phosphoesterase TrpH